MYPGGKFPQVDVDADVHRTRIAERAKVNEVAALAKKNNKPLSWALQQVNMEPATYRNIVHEANIDDLRANLSGVVGDIDKLNDRAKFLLAEVPTIEATGTIRPGSKETYREDVKSRASTYQRKISEMGMDAVRTDVINNFKEISRIATDQALRPRKRPCWGTNSTRL
jgi:hypothetical protein